MTEREPPLPRRVGWLLKGFRWYVRRFLRKNFRAVRISRNGADFPNTDQPLLIVSNHPSWWDPMLGAYLLDHFPQHDHYAAIDAEMLKKYAVFKKLGFFGIDMTSLRGAAEFLRIGTAILSKPKQAVWITAQGEFADVRQRPMNLKPGVGHLAARMTSGWVIPLAIEYCFWNERTPEVLIRLGEPLPTDAATPHAREAAKRWNTAIEVALTQTLDALNAEAIPRDPTRFRTLLGGKTGAGGMYDFFRRLGCWARFKRFDPSHDDSAR